MAAVGIARCPRFPDARESNCVLMCQMGEEQVFGSRPQDREDPDPCYGQRQLEIPLSDN